MKNIYISADIEGIWGNVNGAYTMPGVPEYEQYRRRMIDEVNIAAKALFKHGAQTILVNDGHGNMDNLLPEEMDPRVRLVCSHGAFKAYGMMEGISADMDGVCLIGYHRLRRSQKMPDITQKRSSKRRRRLMKTMVSMPRTASGSTCSRRASSIRPRLRAARC